MKLICYKDSQNRLYGNPFYIEDEHFELCKKINPAYADSIVEFTPENIGQYPAEIFAGLNPDPLKPIESKPKTKPTKKEEE